MKNLYLSGAGFSFAHASLKVCLEEGLPLWQFAEFIFINN
jgi:hypothetical protein